MKNIVQFTTQKALSPLFFLRETRTGTPATPDRRIPNKRSSWRGSGADVQAKLRWFLAL
jgi:hypothetical protein